MDKYYHFFQDYGEIETILCKFSIEESIKRIHEMSDHCSTSIGLAFAVAHSYQPQLVTVIKGNRILAAEAYSISSNTGRSVFSGKLCEINGVVVLRGQFVINLYQKILFWVSLPILPLLFYLCFVWFHDASTIEQKILSILLIPMLYFLPYLYGKIYYFRKIEAEQIQILSQLRLILSK